MEKYETLNQANKEPKAKKRVAAYCRVSTDDREQANSFENQRQYFKRYIESRPDWLLCEIFSDEGVSGTSAKKRKQFNRMIARAENGDFDLIITKEISRFARNTLDSIYYTRKLKERGVGVIFMNDGIDTMDGDAELRLAIMSSIAQEESRKTSERVKWGQKRQMEKGVVFGRSMLGYDIRGGKMYLNEEGAKIVRLIFHKFVNEGKGTYVIARELNEEGARPMRAKRWRNTVILRIIRNEKYCGDLVQQKTYTPNFLSHEKKYNKGQEEFVIIKNHHEPIISRELFEKANRILDAKALSQKGAAKRGNRYPFSGKIKCGKCGASYTARFKKRKNGGIYKAWRCYEATKYGAPRIDALGNSVGCLGESIRNEDVVYIMSLVCKELKYDRQKIISNLIKIIETVIFDDLTATNKSALAMKTESAKQKQLKLIELYASGDIDKSKFTALRLQYDKELEKLKLAAIDAEKQRIITDNQKPAVDIKKIVAELINGDSYEDIFYALLLDKITVNDKNSIDVYLNGLPYKLQFAIAKDAK